MTSRDFVYWLMGYMELTPHAGGLSPKQTRCIQNHLALVFKHDIDPTEPGDAAENQAIHDGTNSHLFGGTLPGGNMARC